MSTPDFTIEILGFTTAVNKGLSKHSLRAYKVDAKGISVSSSNNQSLRPVKNDVRGWFGHCSLLQKGCNLYLRPLNRNALPFEIISG